MGAPEPERVRAFGHEHTRRGDRRVRPANTALHLTSGASTIWVRAEMVGRSSDAWAYYQRCARAGNERRRSQVSANR
jgi:hypothetical protein